jgi:membrane peptidoglycan carboxypeptidase
MKKIGGEAVNTEPPKDLGFRPAVINSVRDAMLSVVAQGTGQRAKLQGMAVGGKTGSAQVVTSARLASDKKARKNQPHGWFIFFAPPRAGKPAVAGATLVEHASSGIWAAQVVGKALSTYYGVPAIGPGMMPPPDTIPEPPQPEATRASFVPATPPPAPPEDAPPSAEAPAAPTPTPTPAPTPVPE